MSGEKTPDGEKLARGVLSLLMFEALDWARPRQLTAMPYFALASGSATRAPTTKRVSSFTSFEMTFASLATATLPGASSILPVNNVCANSLRGMGLPFSSVPSVTVADNRLRLSCYVER